MKEIEIINKSNSRLFFMNFYIKKCIKIIGLNNFRGISVVIIVDDLSDLTLPQDAWVAKSLGYRILGMYMPKSENSEAEIYLSAQEIVRGIPSFFQITPILLLRLVKVLSHEVGHHLFETNSKLLSRTQSDDEELIVETFANQVFNSTKAKFRYICWAFCMKQISEWHLTNAFLDYKEEKIDLARSRFYSAWQFDQENEIARDWFWSLSENNTETIENNEITV